MSHPPVIPRGNRFRREGRYSEGRESGLTGNPDIPDPPNEGPTDLRGRLARIRQAVAALIATVPRVLGLVWSASRILTIGLAIATILRGVVPAITAYIAKLLVDAVVRAIAVTADPSPSTTVTVGPLTVDAVGAVVLLAAAQFLVFAASSFLSTLRNVCQQLLQERVTNTIQLQIMDHAARLDLGFFEDSTSYDLLRRAQQGAASRPLFMVSGVFGLIQTIDRLRLDDLPARRAQPDPRRRRARSRRSPRSSPTRATAGAATASPAGPRRSAGAWTT